MDRRNDDREPLVALADELREARDRVRQMWLADLLKRAERAVRDSEMWRKHWRDKNEIRFHPPKGVHEFKDFPRK